MKLRLRCREVAVLISRGQDEALPWTDRGRMRLHFAACQNCRRARDQLGFLRPALRGLDLFIAAEAAPPVAAALDRPAASASQDGAVNAAPD